jgi:hypothetical protein
MAHDSCDSSLLAVADNDAYQKCHGLVRWRSAFAAVPRPDGPSSNRDTGPICDLTKPGRDTRAAISGRQRLL